MPDSRAEFERKLKLSDAEKAAGALRRIVADFDEIDRELRAAEKRAGLSRARHPSRRSDGAAWIQ